MVGLFNRREVHSVESARLQTQANYLPSLLSLSSAVYRPPLITPMQLPRPQTLNENAICRCSVNMEVRPGCEGCERLRPSVCGNRTCDLPSASHLLHL